MKRGRKFLNAALAAVAASTLGGCLEFEGQTMSYRYDRASDTMFIFQDYHGIYGSDAEGKPDIDLSDEEKDQLKSVLTGQRTFFFENWIYEFNREAAEKELVDLKDPEYLTKKEIKPEHATVLSALLEELVRNVKVENGAFYLDTEDKLCGVQRVTMTNCKAVIAAFNAYGLSLLAHSDESEDLDPRDKKAAAEFRERQDRDIVNLNGNVLTVRWPISKATYENKFGSLAEPDDKIGVENFRKGGIGITYQNGTVQFTFGKEKDEITSISIDFRETKYTPNALRALRADGHDVKKKGAFDPKAAAKEFLR